MMHSRLLKIASLTPGEPLLLCLVILKQAVSVILVVEQNKEEILIYYVSHTLMGFEWNYPLIEFAYALVLVNRKLRLYFEAHKVTVLIDQSLKNVLQKLDAGADC